VNPPGVPDWETTAAAWLLDLVPEYRQHAAVRRHPVILAFIAQALKPVPQARRLSVVQFPAPARAKPTVRTADG
jgi:hypothetical protein